MGAAGTASASTVSSSTAWQTTHERALKYNPCMKLAMAGMRRRPASQRERDARVFRIVRGIVTAGQIVSPDRLHAVTTRGPTATSKRRPRGGGGDGEAEAYRASGRCESVRRTT